MATTISIEVDFPTGNITVAPTLANDKRGEPVTFQTKNRASLTISFPAQSPFDEQQIRDPQGSVTRKIVGAKGSYHYNVAVLMDGRIFVIPGCPEIVVQ